MASPLSFDSDENADQISVQSLPRKSGGTTAKGELSAANPGSSSSRNVLHQTIDLPCSSKTNSKRNIIFPDLKDSEMPWITIKSLLNMNSNISPFQQEHFKLYKQFVANDNEYLWFGIDCLNLASASRNLETFVVHKYSKRVGHLRPKIFTVMTLLMLELEEKFTDECQCISDFSYQFFYNYIKSKSEEFENKDCNFKNLLVYCILQAQRGVFFKMNGVDNAMELSVLIIASSLKQFNFF